MVCLTDAPARKFSKTLEEKMLLDKLAQGDRDAFWELWALYRNYLYQRCRVWMGGNSLDGEEALSLAMLKAWEKLPNYAAQITNVKAWLTRLTHNLCMDLHRQRNRNVRGFENIEELTTASEQDILASSSYSPESDLLRSELSKIIHQRVNALSPRLRDPFILRFYKNLSYQEIAQKLQISRDNVYKRIQEAREFLQKQLQKYFSGLDESFSPHKEDKSLVDNSPTDEVQIISESAVANPIESELQQISYQVTALCLETLVLV